MLLLFCPAHGLLQHDWVSGNGDHRSLLVCPTTICFLQTECGTERPAAAEAASTKSNRRSNPRVGHASRTAKGLYRLSASGYLYPADLPVNHLSHGVAFAQFERTFHTAENIGYFVDESHLQSDEFSQFAASQDGRLSLNLERFLRSLVGQHPLLLFVELVGNGTVKTNIDCFRF